MTSRQALATALATLGAVFDRAVTPEMVEAYALVLGDLEASDVARATRQALATCRFMPGPGELLELAGRGPRTRAADAWAAVMDAKRRYDYTHSVDFGPLVNAVVNNIGGWQYLCGRTHDQLIWDRKKFEEIFPLLAAKPVNELRGVPCLGAFGGEPVRIAIGGVTPPRQIESGANGQINSVVRKLAETKSLQADNSATRRSGT